MIKGFTLVFFFFLFHYCFLPSKSAFSGTFSTYLAFHSIFSPEPSPPTHSFEFQCHPTISSLSLIAPPPNPDPNQSRVTPLASPHRLVPSTPHHVQYRHMQPMMFEVGRNDIVAVTITIHTPFTVTIGTL